MKLRQPWSLLPSIPRSRIHLCYLANKYFSHLPSNSEGVVSPPNGMRTTPTTIFQPTFYYTPVRPTFVMGIGGDTLDASVPSPPIFTKILLGYPNTYILGIDYWGTGGDALSFQPPQMEVSHSLLFLLLPLTFLPLAPKTPYNSSCCGH